MNITFVQTASIRHKKNTQASVELIEKVCASLPLATLVPVEGANHAFKGKNDLIPLLSDSTPRWIDEIL